MVDAAYKLTRLDRRELQVLFSICQGSTPSLIAAQLAIEKTTVRATLFHIFQKLELMQLGDTEARFATLKDVYCPALAGITVEPPLPTPVPEPDPAPIDDPKLALAVDDAIQALDRHRGLQNWRAPAFVQVKHQPNALPAVWPTLLPRRQPRSVPWWWVGLALILGGVVMYSFFPRTVDVPLPQTQIVMITNSLLPATTPPAPGTVRATLATPLPGTSVPAITLSPLPAGTLISAGAGTPATRPIGTASSAGTAGPSNLTPAVASTSAATFTAAAASTSAPTFTPVTTGPSGPTQGAYQSNFQNGPLDAEWAVVNGTPLFGGGALKSMNGEQLILQTGPRYTNFELEYSYSNGSSPNGLEFLLPNSVMFYVDSGSSKLWAMTAGGTKQLWSGDGGGAAATVKLVVKDGAYQVYLNGMAKSPVVKYLSASTGQMSFTLYAQSISSITITPTQ